MKNSSQFKVHSSRLSSGLTLIELLIAAAVMGLLALVSSQMLLNTIQIRSKQTLVEDATDNFKSIVKDITDNIISASSINSYTPSSIKIINNEDRCLEFTLVSPDLLKKLYTDMACSGAAVDSVLNPTGSTISNFEITKTGQSYNFRIEGSFKDNLGDHPIKVISTASPRINL